MIVMGGWFVLLFEVLTGCPLAGAADARGRSEASDVQPRPFAKLRRSFWSLAAMLSVAGATTFADKAIALSLAGRSLRKESRMKIRASTIFIRLFFLAELKNLKKLCYFLKTYDILYYVLKTIGSNW